MAGKGLSHLSRCFSHLVMDPSLSVDRKAEIRKPYSVKMVVEEGPKKEVQGKDGLGA